MSDQFVAEIRIFPYNFAPFGWAMCNGQLMSISQNTALFSLLGTQFGGNGTSNFGLPNLQGCVAVDFGQGAGLSPYNVGDQGGVPSVTLLTSQMPAHNHNAQCVDADGNDYGPTNDVWAKDAGGNNEYGVTPATLNPPTAPGTLAPGALAPVGGSRAHNNMQPYLVLNYCIALVGIFPARA
jgi:microcystin-dependent protein